MSAMKQRVYHSRVLFLRDPATPEDAPVDLGVLVGFTVEHRHTVGLLMTAAVSKTLLASLDPLSREVLENRVSIMRGEILDVLDEADKPEGVLRLVAERNFLSLHVTAPSSMMVDMPGDPQTATAQKLAEDYSLFMFAKASQQVPGRMSMAYAMSDTDDSRGQLRHTSRNWVLPTEVFMLQST